MTPIAQNTICTWYDRKAEDAARRPRRWYSGSGRGHI